MSTYTYIPNLYQFPSLLKALAQTSGPTPSLDLRFALDKSLTAYRGPTPSFSRASTGSYFDGSGVLRYKGYNLCLNSENFSAASWSKTNISASFSSTELSPNGDLTASLVVPNTANNVHHINPSTFNGAASSYTLSIYAKNSGYPVLILDANADVNFGATFNLATGTVTGTSGGSTATITSVGNGWYRCSITKESSFTFLIWRIYPNSSGVYSGDGSSGVLLWGAQVERTAILTDYSKTTSSANSAPRFDHTFNGTSWVSRGLLVEEQRTNLFTYTEDMTNAAYSRSGTTVGANSATWINGQAVADSLIEDSTTGLHFVRQDSPTASAGVAYSVSVFVKAAGRTQFDLQFDNSGAFNTSQTATFDLASGTMTATSGAQLIAGGCGIKNVGGGWYRVSIAATTQFANFIRFGLFLNNGSGLSYTGTNGLTAIYACGFQCEAGAFPTSYIPNLATGSSTRSADVCQITGGDFSGIWNNGEGSAAIEFDSMGATPSADCYLFNASTSGSFTTMALWSYLSTTSNNVIHRLRVGGSDVFNTNIGSNYSPNMPAKTAMAFKSGDSSISFNGFTPVQNSSSFTLSGINTFYIGQSPTGSAVLNGHIARLRYYNKRLPNATLQQLSEPDPTLNLQFALNKTLTPVAGPAPSFSRASTGTYFNASGVLTSASINTPRFDHVYSGGQWVSRGLLVEEQRTNLAQYSEDMSNFFWTKSQATITANDTNAPDGNTTADKIVENTGPVNAGVFNTNGMSFTSGVAYTASAFVKANGRSIFALYFQTNAHPASGRIAWFDISNGTTQVQSGVIATITNVGNGWYRLTATATATATAASGFGLLAFPALGSLASYTGDGVSGFFAWGLSCEAGSFATSYIQNLTTGSTTRSSDVCQITGTSFGSMWNQGEGSVVAEWDSYSASSPQMIASASATSNPANNFIAIRNETFYGYLSGVEQFSLAYSITSNTPNKVSGAYKTNDFAASLNGAAVLTDTAGTLPIQSQFDIGQTAAYSTSPYKLNGHIAKLIYYPARLTNAKLQQLST